QLAQERRAGGIVNPIDELTRLIAPFPTEKPLFERVEHIPASITPEPYRTMLVHEHHMTVAMETHHGCAVDVTVEDEWREGNVYARKSVLTRSDDGTPVQFGLVHFNFQYVTDPVRN